MQKYLLLIVLILPVVWSVPVPAAQSDIASHIVIVTPQAQVHLEPAIKYDTSAFVHHLSPLARIASPHEETIFYVPSNFAAPIIPIDAVNVGRASGNEKPQKLETKQWDQISQQIQQAVQTGSSQLGPQLSEAATAASSAAAAAGQGLFPALFPPGGTATTTTTGKDDKPKIAYELPANTEALLTHNARIFAITPAVSHVVDFIHSPVLISPIPAIRARSIQEEDNQAQQITTSLLESKLPENLPLTKSIKDLEGEPKSKPYLGRIFHLTLSIMIYQHSNKFVYDF